MKNNLVLLLIFACFRMFLQTGEIKGKLLLQDIENIESVRKNTWIILKTATRLDSVKVNHDLSFVFKDVKADTIRIYIKPRTYPNDRSYKIYFNGSLSKELEFEYSSTCSFGKKTNNACPTCHKKDKVIPIRYGLVAEITERSKKRKRKENINPEGVWFQIASPTGIAKGTGKIFNDLEKFLQITNFTKISCL